MHALGKTPYNLGIDTSRQLVKCTNTTLSNHSIIHFYLCVRGPITVFSCSSLRGCSVQESLLTSRAGVVGRCGLWQSCVPAAHMHAVRGAIAKHLYPGCAQVMYLQPWNPCLGFTAVVWGVMYVSTLIWCRNITCVGLVWGTDWEMEESGELRERMSLFAGGQDGSKLCN